MLGFLRPYLGWSKEAYGSKLSNVLISFIAMSQNCVLKYLVCIALMVVFVEQKMCKINNNNFNAKLDMQVKTILGTVGLSIIQNYERTENKNGPIISKESSGLVKYRSCHIL